MKIFAAVLILIISCIAVDFARSDYIPAEPNMGWKFKEPRLVGCELDPSMGQSIWFEVNTASFRAHPEYVQRHWNLFRENLDYVRTHQDICEAAGFKSYFTLRSYLHFPSMTWVEESRESTL
jgi:hypothetical protein